MNGLLSLAMKAHGGLERWKQVRNMQAKVTLNGTLWRIKGRPDGLPGVVMKFNTKQPDLTITPFPKPGTAGDPQDDFPMTMAHDHHGPCIELERSLPSEVAAISPFVDKLMLLFRKCGCVPEGESDVEIALREALANAIIH